MSSGSSKHPSDFSNAPNKGSEFDAPWEQRRPTQVLFTTDQLGHGLPDVDVGRRPSQRSSTRSTTTTVLCDRCHNRDYVPHPQHSVSSADSTTWGRGDRTKDALSPNMTSDQDLNASQNHYHFQNLLDSQGQYEGRNSHDSHHHHAYIQPGPKSAPTAPTSTRDLPAGPSRQSQTNSPGMPPSAVPKPRETSQTRPIAALPGTMSSRPKDTTTTRSKQNLQHSTTTTTVPKHMYVSELYINAKPPGDEASADQQHAGQQQCHECHQQEESVDRSNSGTSSSRSQPRSSSRSRSQSQPGRSSSTATIGKRCKTALKDMFKRPELTNEDDGLRKIEDRHWTEYGASDEESW